MDNKSLSIVELLRASFEKFATKQAYVDECDELTFGELHGLVLGGVSLLREANIEPGHRVALYMNDGADYLVALLAIWSSGAVPVPINRSQKQETVEYVLGQCDSDATLIDEGVDVNASSRRIVWHREARTAEEVQLTAVSGDEDAMILYTSGTTGMPKGVRHVHHALALNAVEMSEMLRLGSSDRVLLNIPFYYSNSISHLLMTLFNGACIYACHGFMFGDALVEAVKQSHATGFAGVPAHYVRIADATEAEVESDLRFLMNSGDHLPIDVLRSLLKCFPEAEIFCAYGISECAPRVCCLEPSLINQKMGSVGRPLPATRVTVRDEDGEPLPAGQLGQVYVDSECLMKEYYRNPEATGRSLSEHGFATGDMGYLDEDGCLFLSGRTDSVFKSGGEKVSCRLIEETLRDSEHFAEAFSDVVVTEGPDHFLGKVARVYYVPRGDDEALLKVVRRELKNSLPRSHVPKEFIALKNIERSPSGKIVKQSLSDPANLLRHA